MRTQAEIDDMHNRFSEAFEKDADNYNAAVVDAFLWLQGGDTLDPDGD